MSKQNQNTAPTTGRTFNPIRVGDGKEAVAWVKVGNHTISVDGRIGKGEMHLSQLLKSVSGRKALVVISKIDRECNLAVREALGKEVCAKLGIDRSYNSSPLLDVEVPSSRQEAITALAKLITAADPMQVLSVQPGIGSLAGQPLPRVKTFTVLDLLTLAKEKDMTVEQVLESIIADFNGTQEKGDFDGDQICAVELESLADKAKDVLVEGLTDRLKSGELDNPLNALRTLGDSFKGFGSSMARSVMAGRDGRSMGVSGEDRAKARAAIVDSIVGGKTVITGFETQMTMNPEFREAMRVGLFNGLMKRHTGKRTDTRFKEARKLFGKKARKAGEKLKITK